MNATIERFLGTLYGPARATDGVAFVTAILNESAGQGEKKLLTRDLEAVEAHVRRWDEPGRAVYVCVNLIRSDARRRAKETVAALVACHTDLDFKNIDPSLDRAEVLRRIGALRYRPTMIVDSGNGLHLYWVLGEPLEATDANIALVEMLNGQLTDVLGADPGTHDVTRLLRLPGTHNSKRGEWKPVMILETTGELHDVADLEDWLSVQSPVIERLAVSSPSPDRREGASPAASNPWLETAKRLGFKVPIDADARLARMSYQGAGDASIHQTQIQVTASMLSRGIAENEVVAAVLDATRAAAGEMGSRWNWRLEEASLRRMCAAWIRKNPEIVQKIAEAPAAAVQPVAERKVANGGNVVQLVQPAASGKEPPKKKGKKAIVHAVIGEAVIAALRARDEDLIVTAGQLWRYADGVWSSPDLDGRRWLEVEIEVATRALSIASDNSLVNETRNWLLRNPEIYRETIEFDPKHLVPFADGVYDLAAGIFRPVTADDRMTYRLTVQRTEDAACPRFLAFLQQILEPYGAQEVPEIVEMLREWIGLGFVRGKARELRKALLVNGPSRTGKTQLAEIVRQFYGERTSAMSVSALAERFGLQSLYGNLAWISDDAIGSIDELADETFKRVVTGEKMRIDLKGIKAAEGRLEFAILFTANNLPRVKDASDAVYNRLILLSLTRVFSEEASGAASAMASEPLADSIFRAEGPQIAAWALAGARHALARGRLVIPACLKAQIERFREDNNPVASWARECLEAKPHFAVDRRDLLASFNAWLKAMYGDEARVWGGQRFVPKLRAIVPQIADDVVKGWPRARGIALTERGLDYIEHENNRFPATTVGSGKSPESVNQIVKVDVEPPEPQRPPPQRSAAPRF